MPNDYSTRNNLIRRAQALVVYHPESTEYLNGMAELIAEATTLPNDKSLNTLVTNIKREITNPSRFQWFDFEAEPEMTGDGSGDPDKYYLTIADGEGEEFAVIVHRASDMFPIEGELANQKRERAQVIVDALNMYHAK